MDEGAARLLAPGGQLVELTLERERHIEIGRITGASASTRLSVG